MTLSRYLSALYILLIVAEFLFIGVLVYERSYLLRDPSSNIRDWLTTWGGKGRDYAFSLTFSGGNLFVTGVTRSYGPGDQNLLLMKYSSDGHLIWNTTYWNGGSTLGRGIVSDANSLYVCGIHASNETSSSLLLRYDLDGRLLWSKEWGENTTAIPTGVALDGLGNIYVTGYNHPSTLEVRGFLLKYTKNGSLLFDEELNSNSTEIVWGITVGDGVYVCGTQWSGAGSSQVSTREDAPYSWLTLRKLTYDGKEVWKRDSWQGQDSSGFAVAVGDDVYAAGYTSFSNDTSKSLLVSYTIDGVKLGESIFGESELGGSALGLTAAGPYTYVVGTWVADYFLEGNNAFVSKLGSDGEQIWRRNYGGPGNDAIRSVVIVGDDVYVAGELYYEEFDGQVLIIKYHSPNSVIDPTLVKALEYVPIVIGAALCSLLMLEGSKRLKVRGYTKPI